MGFRENYIKATGLKLNKNIHIHHIDGNRNNNLIDNLVHTTLKKHIRYHRLLRMVRDVLKTLEINDWDIKDLNNDRWVRGFCIPFSPMDNWFDKLYSCEAYLLKKVEIRNELTGITTKNVFITNLEKEVIEIYKNNKRQL